MPDAGDVTEDRDIDFVDDAAGLAPALARIDRDVVGVDVERADSHRYFRSAALIQVGVEERCVLVDSVVLDDLSALDRFLDGRLAVLHAIENDVEPLAAAGVTPDRVADTSVAASMLGLPTGLGPLLGELLGVQLTEDKDAYQRADWELRPLPADMAAYAAGDVFHLPALWAELADRLDQAGRRDWYEQELATTLERAGEDRRDWTRTKGAGRLSPGARAVLRALWEEREAIAREFDIAPNRLLRDATMLDVAEKPASSPQELVRRNKRRHGPLANHAERIFAAMQRGVAAPEEPVERDGRRVTQRDRAAYDALRRTRARVAKEIGIDAGVLCPGRPLMGAVLSDPQTPEALCDAAGLRPWQTALLAEPLWDAYQRVLAKAEHAS